MTKRRRNGRWRKCGELDGMRTKWQESLSRPATFPYLVSIYLYEGPRLTCIVPVLRPLPTIAPVQTKLLAAVSELKITRDENEHNLETTSKDLSALEEQERDLRQQVELMETKREWAEEFGGWVEMLGGFLEEKVRSNGDRPNAVLIISQFPLLESIEVDSIDHLHERSEVTIKRRQLDDEDDLSVFLGQVDSTPDDSVDELGRPTNRNAEAGPSSAARRSRRGEREARRLRRRVRLSQPVREDDEGFSTDASLGDADQADYDAAQRRLEQRVQSLLDDVKAEDFRDPERGLAVRFGDWRRRYPEDYDGAFGGLGMVHAWEFWARGEMVGWEPSRSETAIESFRWFSALYAYSRPKASMNGNGHHVDDDDMDLEEEPPLGPDGDLVTVMVDRAVVPLLVKAFEAGAYDLYSAGQTRRTVDLVDVVKELTGKDSRKFNASPCKIICSMTLILHRPCSGRSLVYSTINWSRCLQRSRLSYRLLLCRLRRSTQPLVLHCSDTFAVA